ncbi:MAG: hypothetical protein U0Q11_03460 [Vicinamibacterales bacterium]
MTKVILESWDRTARRRATVVVETTSPRQAQKPLAERLFDLLVVDNVMRAS